MPTFPPHAMVATGSDLVTTRLTLASPTLTTTTMRRRDRSLAHPSSSLTSQLTTTCPGPGPLPLLTHDMTTRRRDDDAPSPPPSHSPTTRRRNPMVPTHSRPSLNPPSPPVPPSPIAPPPRTLAVQTCAHVTIQLATPHWCANKHVRLGHANVLVYSPLDHHPHPPAVLYPRCTRDPRTGYGTRNFTRARSTT
ncbi:hypothetical protein JVT61DRAFT_1754 [Boletus reticuloceps]|uniref:Uncharacterized protein n=1 Tax=Boletus reticuloceps TaxID=495285 RepID=A0A8I2YRA4_9AGAM|nr:hypothetical protein JVT61DRAFT_1754 [Boletus reticuloceps]